MKKIRKLKLIDGMAATLVVVLATAALAVAAGGNDNNTNQGNDQRPAHRGPGGPGGPGGPPFLKDMTNAEIHVYRNGSSSTLRVDQGKVKSVDGDSLTITERDNQDVTIPTDGDTEVHAGPKGEIKLSDLRTGQAIVVERAPGEAADKIGVLPKRGERPPGPPPFQGSGQGDHSPDK